MDDIEDPAKLVQARWDAASGRVVEPDVTETARQVAAASVWLARLNRLCDEHLAEIRRVQ